MLRFSPDQAASILDARRRFNQRQVALAANETILEGNALPIPVDAWRRIDQRATMLMRYRLAVFNRLAAANTVPVSMADLVNYYPQIGDSNEVHVSMDGRNQAKADQANVKYVGTPVPVLTSTVRMGWRQMEVLRKGGAMLDTSTIANAQRKMIEKLEDMVLNGLPSVVVGTDTVYGLRTLPQRNTGNHGFTLATTATGANWVTAFTQLINAVQGDNAFGPITVFLNWTDYTAAATKDYVNGSNVTQGTILQRLLQIPAIREIIPAGAVPANEIIGVADVDAGEWGSILSGMPMTVRPKMRDEPEDDYIFTVISAAAPQFRVDYAGNAPFGHIVQ
jgi:uncharacterized linocin/CFP29 family protein